MIEGMGLPKTAQVAAQKGKHLARSMNSQSNKRFQYIYMGQLAYIGGWKAIAQLPGRLNLQSLYAWVLWRSAYLTMCVSWKNKMLIPIFWFTSWFFGREMSKYKR